MACPQPEAAWLVEVEANCFEAPEKITSVTDDSLRLFAFTEY